VLAVQDEMALGRSDIDAASLEHVTVGGEAGAKRTYVRQDVVEATPEPARQMDGDEDGCFEVGRRLRARKRSASKPPAEVPIARMSPFVIPLSTRLQVRAATLAAPKRSAAPRRLALEALRLRIAADAPFRRWFTR
jgi:hypothetical protein